MKSIIITLYTLSALLFAGAEAYSGDMTYYDVGVGSCGYNSSDNDHVLALSVGIMKNPANPNANPKCGTHINIYNPSTGSSNGATVVDTCQACAQYDIDVSPALFQAVAPEGNGRVHGIEWGGSAVGGKKIRRGKHGLHARFGMDVMGLNMTLAD